MENKPWVREHGQWLKLLNSEGRGTLQNIFQNSYAGEQVKSLRKYSNSTVF
jgi:hypothetical protein